MINNARKHAFDSEQNEAVRPFTSPVFQPANTVTERIDPGVFAVDDFLSEEQEIEILRQLEMTAVE